VTTSAPVSSSRPKETIRKKPAGYTKPRIKTRGRRNFAMKVQYDKRITSPTSQLPKPEDYKDYNERAAEAWEEVHIWFDKLQLSEWIWDKTYFDWEKHLEMILKT
jgi:hypothetical protein